MQRPEPAAEQPAPSGRNLYESMGVVEGKAEKNGHRKGRGNGAVNARQVHAFELICPKHNVPYGTPLKPCEGENKAEAYASFQVRGFVCRQRE